MAEPIRNLHGRKGTRGLRPWLLVPKVLAVALYLGGSAAAIVLWFHADLVGPAWRGGAASRNALEDAARLLASIRLLYVGLVVPALVAALVLGLLLVALQGPRVFLRLRWLQVKLAILAVGVPLAHFYLSSHVSWLRHHSTRASPSELASTILGISWAMPIIFVVSVLVMVFGRLKPRLGQNWARDYPAGKAAAVLLAAGVLLMLGGCPEPAVDLTGRDVAPDFAVEFNVHTPPGPAPAATSAAGTPARPDAALLLTQSAQFVLEPNRKLRVAVGHAASPQWFPALTRLIEPPRFEALYEHVRRHHLMSEPASPGAEAAATQPAAASVVYRVVLRAYGRTHRYATTADESPPTRELHRMLAALVYDQAAAP